jgi:hypothetical protein
MTGQGRSDLPGFNPAKDINLMDVFSQAKAGCPPVADEWAAAAWRLQAWVASCFDVTGLCTLCGGPGEHLNGCPWPGMRVLLDRSPGP